MITPKDSGDVPLVPSAVTSNLAQHVKVAKIHLTKPKKWYFSISVAFVSEKMSDQLDFNSRHNSLGYLDRKCDCELLCFLAGLLASWAAPSQNRPSLPELVKNYSDATVLGCRQVLQPLI